VVCEGRASERAARGGEVAAGREPRTLNFELRTRATNSSYELELRALINSGFERDGLQAVRMPRQKYGL
jgi:hypothetical protein